MSVLVAVKHGIIGRGTQERFDIHFFHATKLLKRFAIQSVLEKIRIIIWNDGKFESFALEFISMAKAHELGHVI